ncbi:oxidoreductase [Xylogone sp. PMI_703]|nr:oxidoreductase [Xylogone sp. PMI_703]
MAASPFPSFTKTWHTEPYPFISPKRPELSAKGKNVIVTGGATGIGNSIAVAFAQAGAKSVSIIGRRLDKLKEGEKTILATASNEVTVLYETADLMNRDQTIAAFKSIAEKVGKVDILVSNAGTGGGKGEVATFSAESLMENIGLAVVTALHAFQAFLPVAGPNPILLNTSTGLAHIAPWPGAGPYPTSKAAALKLTDYIAAENPHIHVVSIQPGWVPTELNGYEEQAMDSVDLPGHFYVWLASPEAAFLRNKLVWVNWDAEELIQRAEEIKNSRLLTWVLDGVPM